MKFDFWYGNTLKDVYKVDCYFSDIDCIYRGNLYNAAGEIIGDFTSPDSATVEKYFPGIF